MDEPRRVLAGPGHEERLEGLHSQFRALNRRQIAAIKVECASWLHRKSRPASKTPAKRLSPTVESAIIDEIDTSPLPQVTAVPTLVRAADARMSVYRFAVLVAVIALVTAITALILIPA